MTYAAIDIGSNAVRLLIKRDEEKCRYLDKLLLVRVPLRLGFDVFSKGEISDKKADDLVRLMRSYELLMKIYRVDRMRACATSAMRDAKNGSEIIKKIAAKTGIKVEIITGAEEARIVYFNHLGRGFDSKGNFLYVDVGGGSTELNLLTNGELKLSESFNIGTVRMLTDSVKAKTWSDLSDTCLSLGRKYPDITLVGSGGNINKLYKLASGNKKKEISVEALQGIYEDLLPLSVEERMVRYSMRPDRADVIIPAAKIFLTIARLTGAKNILVPQNRRCRRHHRRHDEARLRITTHYFSTDLDQHFTDRHTQITLLLIFFVNFAK